MPPEREKVGFWSSLRKLTGADIFGPELLGALIIGIGGGTVLLAQTQAPRRVEIAADFLYIIAPLLGVVFAAFALVIALFSDDYIRALNANRNGVAAFLRPFLVTIGLQVGAALLAVAYRSGADVAPSEVEVGAWLALCFLFVFALLDVVALGRAVMLHGITRAEEIEVRDLEAEAAGKVLPHRRQSSPEDRRGG